MLGQRVYTTIGLLFLLLLITLTQGGCAVPIRPDEPLMSYEIGRLLVTVPQSMKPLIEDTTFMWKSLYYKDKPYAYITLGYPITLWEKPYKSGNNSNAELLAAVEEQRKKNLYEATLEWDVSQIFGAPAYFICYMYSPPKYKFHVIVASQLCLVNLTGTLVRAEPYQPKNDDETQKIIQTLAEMYSKYRPGHDTRTGNVLYTFYGEIVDNPLATDEIMSAQFENSQWTLSVDTDVNIHNQTEEKLRMMMERMNAIGGLRRSQMRKMRHFGFGYEYFRTSGDYTELGLDYEGPLKDALNPSLRLRMMKEMEADMSLYLGAWEIVLENLRQVQGPAKIPKSKTTDKFSTLWQSSSKVVRHHRGLPCSEVKSIAA